MTRKKYDRDIEGEAIHAVYGKEDSESETEEEEEIPHDPWDDVQMYMDEEMKYSMADWISKWFDASDLIRIIETEYYEACPSRHIKDYLFRWESAEHVNGILDHVWNIFDICRIEPTLIQLYSATLELLRERTKYYYVNDTCTHRSITNRKFFRREKRSSVPYTNSQQ